MVFQLKVAFELFKFPSFRRNSGKLEEWIRQLKRENKDKTLSEPCDSNKVFSEHLIDRKRTVPHLFPKDYQIRRQIIKLPIPKIETKKYVAEDIN